LFKKDVKKVYKLKSKQKNSSARWLLRHLNDPFVRESRQCGYVSRSAIKLKQIQEKFDFLKENAGKVLDLGCAPGGWCQVLEEFCHGKNSLLMGIDLQPMKPMAFVDFFQGDFLDLETQKHILSRGPFHVILSDMAPASSGHRTTDRLRMESIIEGLWSFARQAIAPEGCLLFKSLKGGLYKDLEQDIRACFKIFRTIKPQATYQESSEVYCLGQGFIAPCLELATLPEIS
jgi:23S rRNA (uridine2552-2'-O)-methyltransferase